MRGGQLGDVAVAFLLATFLENTGFPSALPYVDLDAIGERTLASLAREMPNVAVDSLFTHDARWLGE